MEIIQIDERVVSKLSLKLENSFLHAGISPRCAKSLKEACYTRLQKDGIDAFMVTVRTCCEELHLKFASILEEVLEDIDKEDITNARMEILKDNI